MQREPSLQRLRDRDQPWDVVVIGGGATGIGVALDAASRGLDVLLLERFDFGKGTSSRSTKLVHGGVRYLAQGNITLVRDALKERALLAQNAPDLVSASWFVIPCRSWWRWLFYGIGLKVYDLLATGNGFERSRMVSSKRALEMAPTLSPQNLRGGVLYQDGQFDDARLLIAMARTADRHGACLLNYVGVTGLLKDEQGAVTGVVAKDAETEEVFEIDARQVVNAAGPFCDEVRRLDESHCEPMLSASQGVHIVLRRSFLPGDAAIIVPKTTDGRVIFLIPWKQHVVVGTTDTPIPHAEVEPQAQEHEIEFLLQTASEYLTEAPTRGDVLSVFTGIRPLVKGDPSARTASLSRDHVIRVSDAGLMTITGGKWTTVRKMAEDCVDRIATRLGGDVMDCRTQTLPLELPPDERESIERDCPELAEPIHPSMDLRGSDVMLFVRNEMARTVEDVLARRTRALYLNASVALEAAPRVAELISAELGLKTAWIDDQQDAFRDLTRRYSLPTNPES
ncbi:MAG: glycerol-3-phosphate dehydrogenase/oxidase [Planctomycetota bacterium]